MAIKRKIKAAPKPVAKPEPRPTSKATKVSAPTPSPALTQPQSQLDLVRSPNFDAAMAQRNYDNFIAEQRARMETERGGLAYNQIPPMGTGGTALPQEFSNLTPSYDVSKLIADYQAQRDAPGLMPIGKFSPEQMQNLTPDRRQALEQRIGMQQGVQQSTNSTAGYMPVDPNINMPSLMPIQTPKSDALNQDLANRGMGGGIPTPIPQNQQMQSYQNFLNQGMNNMASMNQGAAKSFANTQPRMQKLMPTQRKFSTVSNQPARFA